MDLLTQLNRAMEYIEAHIADGITIADASSVTSYSPYHFGRLFYYITDMPLSEYIRKRKLSQAALELQGSAVKVIDVAVRYGYDSADSFTRAFVRHHGVTPSAARQAGISLTLFPPLTFQIQIKGVQAMNWRIEEREAFEVFGMERILTNHGTNQAPEFWAECHRNGSYEKLFDDAGGKRYPDGHGYPREDGSCVINALCGYGTPEGDVFPYMLFALKTPASQTAGYKVVQVPKATWVVFRSEKSDTVGLAIPELFSRAYSEWLPTSGYDKAQGPDMEIYYTDADGKNYEEVWIPVKKQ